MQNLCGVDVSKDWLDAFAEPGHHCRFANTPEGIGELARFCRGHRAGLVVMEASGGVERLAYALLWEQGLPAALVNPRGVRDFARARRIEPTAPPSLPQQELT